MKAHAYLEGFCLLALLSGCVTTPVTGEKALILVPFSQEVELGQQAYIEILQKEKLSTDRRLTEIVRKVGGDIARASDMPDLDWEFNLFESSEKNAFALPGGKVGVYTGILEVARNEAGLAAILGHEIAHAVARHGAQRMTQSMILGLGLTAADISLKDDENKDLILGALGLGATVGVMLPYSRHHESEADHIGTVYMARAGYDPREAVSLWERFAAVQRRGTPEFLSTHPLPKHRVEALEKIAGEAMGDYRRAPVKHDKGRDI